jgi:WD40 repeat protein
MQRSFINLCHSLSKKSDSVLCLTSCLDYLLAGTESGSLVLYELNTMRALLKVKSEIGTILAIHCFNNLVFASSNQGIVKIWTVEVLDNETVKLKPLFSLYGVCESGNILSIAYCDRNQTLYMGFADCSIQWYDICVYF